MRLQGWFVLLLWMVTCTLAFTQSRKYEYTVDLTNVQNDRLHVELIPPQSRTDEIKFFMPRTIPGIYAIADYGRFVKDISVTDKKGNVLPTERLDANTWRIQKAKKINRITYWVDDTFDAPADGAEIFWPAGTNIEDGKNFILNASGFFGYLEGITNVPFRINIVRTHDFYGSTGLIQQQKTNQKQGDKNKSPKALYIDVYETTDYDELIDSPFMYSKPDTSSIRVGNTKVLVGSYSPNKLITAEEIASSIKDVITAQKDFLGGKLPVDKYAFIFYFTDQPVMTYGALEHSYSSVYYMPEERIDEMSEQLRDIAAHEFFHILTPLTIHSENLDNFDFNEPRMSQHLWMYEGVPEYFASSVRVKYGLLAPDAFLNVLLGKMHTSEQFVNDVPMTVISKYTLDKYHDQFYNFYHKGALIALCLDLKLLKMSGGKYSLRNLMLDLSKKFGKDKSFSDDSLFDEITKMTFPEIAEFFNRYVKGIEVLPLKELFASVGVNYTAEKKYEDYSLGITSSEVSVTELYNKPKLQIASTKNQNAMGTALGLAEGDVLISINDETLPELGPELGEMLHRQHKSLPDLKTLTYVVLRKNESGEWKEVRLSAPVTKIEIVKRHLMQFDPAATTEQLALRDAWLKP
jgi:predicted metalloprotease with PDZ domain